MKTVILNNILIVDTDEKKAKFQKFIDGINIITSIDNSCGKSCLIKSIYYCFGANTSYDSKWNEKNKLIIINFQFNNDKYRICRYYHKYLIFKNNDLIESTKNTSTLSNSFENIFNFSIYLKSKKDKNGNYNYIIAPPAFTLLPFYIDQDKRDTVFEPFEQLTQFDKNERDKALFYHLGIYDKTSISLEENKNKIDKDISKNNNELEKLTYTKNILDEESNNIIYDINNITDIENNLLYDKKELENVINLLSESRNKIQKLQSMIIKYNNKLLYLEENSKIYSDVCEDIIVCSNCGHISNIESILKKEYIFANKNIIKKQIKIFIVNTKLQLNKEENNYLEINNKLKSLENTISNNNNNFEIYTKIKGTEKIKNNINDNINKLNIILKNNIKESKNIKKKLKEIDNNKKNVDNLFKNYFKKLSNESNIRSLIEFNDISLLRKKSDLSGFAGEAYSIIMHISFILTMKESNNNCIIFPLLIDSPRSIEASKNNSFNILKLITDKIEFIPQIIISTVDAQTIYTPNENDNLIELKDNLLLNENDYSSNIENINYIKELMDRI